MTYIFILILTLFLANFSLRISDSNNDIVSYAFKQNYLIIIFISLFISIRYEVGTDWQGYVDHYNFLSNTSMSYNLQNFEFGYYYLAYFFSNLGLSYQFFFFFIALLTWFFLKNSFDRKFFPYFIFILFTSGLFFWSLSGIRQFVALSIFTFSIQYLRERNLKIYLLLVFISYLFHQSSLVLILFYFIPFFKDFGRNSIVFIFLITNIPILFKQFDFSSTYLRNFIDYFGVIDRYSSYVNQERVFTAELSELGFGFWAFQILTLVLLWYGYNLKHINKNYLTVYNIFALGAILFNFFYDFELVNRILIYPKMSMIYLYSILFYYWHRDSNYNIHFLTIGLSFVIYFFALIIRSASECCPYNFLF